MDFFQYKDDRLHCENVDIRHITEKVGTPAYIYSINTLKRHAEKMLSAFEAYPTTLCFAVKANSHGYLLKTLFDLGFGADLVSEGELERALEAGVDSSKVVFSGVGKTKLEIERALKAGILSFNVESPFELEDIISVSKKLDKQAKIAFRINPNIDAKTNPKIATGLYATKFGMLANDALSLTSLVKQNNKHVKLVGLACHIGSQMTSLGPIAEAVESMLDVCKQFKDDGHELEFLNMGGGLGIKYKNETPPSLEEYAEVLISRMKGSGLKLILEPGRVLMGNVGVLITEVIGVKKTPEKNFLIVDAAMNDLLRPTLYNAYHDIISVNNNKGEQQTFDVVGPVCETGDFFGKDRIFVSPNEGDLICVRGTGAYGATMASNYNSRRRPAEIAVDKNEAILISKRQNLQDIWSHEIQGGENI